MEEVKAPEIIVPRVLMAGSVKEWSGPTSDVYSPICHADNAPVKIGSNAVYSAEQSVAALEAADRAWLDGRGAWPQTKIADRIASVQRFVEKLLEVRQKMIDILMWEICKTRPDSEGEFDRTIKYIKQTCEELQRLEQENVDGKSVQVKLRRTPLGVTLLMGPANYPFNETYCMLIPALLMGNTVVMKLPNVGGLIHQYTVELFADMFPPGVVNFVTGRAREGIVAAMMATGKVSVLGFIGGSEGADAIIKSHPHPHRLYAVLGLDAKNVGIVLPSADLDNAVKQCVAGAFSYNGQRCTALKMLFVHEDIVDTFLEKFNAATDALPRGNPWEPGVKITPLQPRKCQYIQDLVADAIKHGARVTNSGGGKVNHNIFSPAVLYPCNSKMRVWKEEQFGPCVPVVSFSSPTEALDWVCESMYGQQASIFGENPAEMNPLINVLANQVARININLPCSRGPDHLPFTARKSSALRTLSVKDALLTFSIESMVVAGVGNGIMDALAADESSGFMS
mmetsp:Transcript_6755/g.12776  ORF Transcript_6755/g.12776 Transcript_6755/m.12776 type:complete len:510 (+) Transcript_6755:48-1577(+)|eukprot:CAMPEP_0175125086 /NCGR_PEP_ID=MMETSP0087-20121206/3127_1 /TAXON_ID=136419 /ORGANISM="Unknown Unknown, Strain D1" /LENGTH=509 /DNA_ID=CAMNT_0016406897 /DNA_START=51 /DNA_END=1580 /DNA_ORIENTATION=+